MSLEKQYELLLKRIPSNRKIESFREFIEKCFPTAMLKKYYLSCPNFLREKRGGTDGSPLFLNNLVQFYTDTFMERRRQRNRICC